MTVKFFNFMSLNVLNKLIVDGILANGCKKTIKRKFVKLARLGTRAVDGVFTRAWCFKLRIYRNCTLILV